jgi:hypothetical protein
LTIPDRCGTQKACPYRCAAAGVPLAIIVVILATQAGVGFVNTGVRAWPLVAYPMYKTAHFEGERLDHALNVYVILPNAEKAPITPSDLNMGFWLFLDHVVADSERSQGCLEAFGRQIL